MANAPATTGTRGPYRTGIRRRAEIIDNALTAFAELGYTGGSIRVIAERAGVSSATVLQHFGSKEGLLQAVLDEWDRRGPDNAHLEEARGIAYFRRIPHVMEYNNRHRGLIELFLTVVAESSNPDHPAREFVRTRYEHNRETIAAHLQEAISRGDARSLAVEDVALEAQTLTAVLDGIQLQWLIDPSIDIAAVAERYIEQSVDRWCSTSASEVLPR